MEKIQIKHPPLFNCERADEQCYLLNERLKNKHLAISGEPYINNIIVHYVVGFLIIYTLLKLDMRCFRITRTYPFILMGAILGWFLADVISYITHFTIDSQFWKDYVTKRDSKGYAVVDGHHEFTLNYSYLNNVELVSITYPLYVPILVALSVAHFYFKARMLKSPFYIGFFVSLTFNALMSGYYHRWAHERTHNLVNNPFIKILQDWHIILNSKQHRKHHIEEKDDERLNFSLTNGTAEIILDPLLSSCRKSNICKF